MSNRSGNRTVCGTVSVVTQGPPWWRKWLLTLHLYHMGALVSVPESEHATNFPGFRDFIEQFLATSDSDVANLIDAACFYEQFAALWSGAGGRRYTGVDRVGDKFLRVLASKLYAPSARALRVASMGEITGVRVYPPSNESRVEFLIRVADELQDATAQPLVESVLLPLRALWEEGIADRQGLFRLLQVLTDRGLREGDGPFAAARQCLLTYAEELEHFQAAVSFCEAYPNEVSEGDRDGLRSKFRKFAEEYSDELDDEDPDWLREVAGDLEKVGHKLQVDTDPFTADLYERAGEIETGAFPISRSRAHTHRRHGHPLQTVPSAGLRAGAKITSVFRYMGSMV